VAELGNAVVGGISAVHYDDDYVFIGNHFVLPPYRGSGIGTAIWEYALALAGDKTIGASGLSDGREFYEDYGFESTSNIIQYGGVMFAEARLSDDIYSAQDIDIRYLVRYDASRFGTHREKFIRAWLDTVVMDGVCLLKEGSIQGWGCLRRCRRGWRLGPVFAEKYEYAEEIVRHLAMKTYTEWVFIDLPQNNVQAIRLAFAMGMTPLGARIRVVRGDRVSEPLDQIFGFTTLDIG